MNLIPVGLIWLRAALAPVMVLLALFAPNRLAIGLCLSVAFLSDIFDGVIARRLGVATVGLRRLDSAVDTIFYVCTAFAAWYLHPSVISEHAMALIVLGAMEISRYVFDAWKFGREASYHMWSSKLWGIALFVGLSLLLTTGYGGITISAAIYIGIITDVEGLVISFILRDRHVDVPTFVHALRMRNARPT